MVDFDGTILMVHVGKYTSPVFFCSFEFDVSPCENIYKII